MATLLERTAKAVLNIHNRSAVNPPSVPSTARQPCTLWIPRTLHSRAAAPERRDDCDATRAPPASDAHACVACSTPAAPPTQRRRARIAELFCRLDDAPAARCRRSCLRCASACNSRWVKRLVRPLLHLDHRREHLQERHDRARARGSASHAPVHLWPRHKAAETARSRCHSQQHTRALSGRATTAHRSAHRGFLPCRFELQRALLVVEPSMVSTSVHGGRAASHRRPQRARRCASGAFRRPLAAHCARAVRPPRMRSMCVDVSGPKAWWNARRRQSWVVDTDRANRPPGVVQACKIFFARLSVL